MSSDSLGDRMKGYESVPKHRLTPRTPVMMWSMAGQIPDEGYPRLVQDLRLCAGAIQMLIDKGHVYTPKEKK